MEALISTYINAAAVVAVSKGVIGFGGLCSISTPLVEMNSYNVVNIYDE